MSTDGGFILGKCASTYAFKAEFQEAPKLTIYSPRHLVAKSGNHRYLAMLNLLRFNFNLTNPHSDLTKPKNRAIPV